jgi:hypothetical protein
MVFEELTVYQLQELLDIVDIMSERTVNLFLRWMDGEETQWMSDIDRSIRIVRRHPYVQQQGDLHEAMV